MKTVDGLFSEFSAALQFPDYFGENWAAFDECLADLDWLPAPGYIVCITQADQVLVDAYTDAFHTLIRILAKVGVGWGGANQNLAVRGRSPAPFHVLLICASEAISDIQQRLSTMGVAAELVSL